MLYIFRHLDYQIILMTMCQLFIQEQWDSGLIPREVVANAKRYLNVLMRLYYLRHSFSHADAYLVPPLSKLGFMALHSINDPISQQEVDYTISTLLLALQGLREQSRNYYITKTAYYILKDQLRLEEARLLQDSEDPETAVDESPGLLGEIQSAWTPRIIDISDDPVAEELSKLVKQYLGLASDRQSDNGTDYD
ncbi:hypothetical protein PMIN02_001318 [Paraphaeosphaeria minitans]